MDLASNAAAQAGGQSNEEEAAKQAQEEQMRRDLLATVLDTAARERCTSATSTRYCVRLITLVSQ